MNQELQEAISAFLDKKEKESRILEITTREGKCCIAVDDIIFLESRQHYLKICCENESYELRGRISDYETMLEKYGFVRVNIGFIINCKYIKILKTKKIILCNGMEINIGSNRHDKVRHAYMEYVREKNKWKL
ncbi:MAG: LytTR family transcriptional regulator DNA-binding domain-containing protein [Roseburia inulinivorans]